MRTAFVPVLAVLIAAATVTAAEGTGAQAHRGDPFPQTLVTATSQHDVHWKVKAVSRHADDSLCLDIHERGPSGSGIYGCQSNEAPCEAIGISTHSVGQVVDGGQTTGQLLTASGQVTRKVRSVQITVEDASGARQVDAKVKFISRADAKRLGVRRFGWWFAALDGAEFESTTTATAFGRDGNALGSPSIHSDEDGFFCG